MRKRLPKHLSYDYQLKLEQVPAKQSDRLPLKVVLPAIFLGFLMILLGSFELMNGMYSAGEWEYKLAADIRAPLISHTFVDFSFIIIGLGIIISSIVSHIRYKKIFFNGKNFSVDLRGVFGETEMFREFLRNYDGVRLRLEFFQFGILNKSKYIIELDHRDPQKSIPLYISTDGTGIYQIWHYYAKRLGMPTIIDTDEGTVVREVTELDKSLKEYLFSKGMISIYDEAPKTPKDIACFNKEGRTIIKPRRIFWDVFKLLGAFWLTFYLAIIALAAFNFQRVERLIGSPTKTVIVFTVAILLAVLFIGILFKKGKIILKDGKLVIVQKFLFFSRKEYADLNRIKDIQVAYNPTTERYYLSIITDDNMLAFGKSMPIENLQWIRDLIIYRMTR